MTNRVGASHERLRPVSEQRLPGQSSREDGGGGSEQKHAPAPVSEPDQKTESDQDAQKSHASDAFEQDIEIESGAASEIRAMRLQKRLCGPSPFFAQ